MRPVGLKLVDDPSSRFFHAYDQLMFVGANVKFVDNQTEMNSLALHELLHVIDTYGVPLSAWAEKDAEWHERIYRIQWGLRNDPRFYLDPKRDSYNDVYRKCTEFGGGCAK